MVLLVRGGDKVPARFALQVQGFNLGRLSVSEAKQA